MKTLNDFRTHVPDDILKDNQNLESFIDVLNGILGLKKGAIEQYKRNFLYPLVDDDGIRRSYIDEWAGEYTENSNKFCLDCLYNNRHYIYSKKGTFDGFVALLKCLCYVDEIPVVEITSFNRGNELILSDYSFLVDYLPNIDDILNDFNGVVTCPTLLGDSFSGMYDSIEIKIGLNYDPTDEFTTFIKSVIPKYLPMVNESMFNINITFYRL